MLGSGLLKRSAEPRNRMSFFRRIDPVDLALIAFLVISLSALTLNRIDSVIRREGEGSIVGKDTIAVKIKSRLPPEDAGKMIKAMKRGMNSHSGYWALVEKAGPSDQRDGSIISLRVRAQIRDGEYSYEGQPLKIGKTIEFIVGDSNIEGDVISISPLKGNAQNG